MNRKNFTILVAEDNDDDVILLKRKIGHTEKPVNLVVAKDGNEALNYIYNKGKYKDNEKYPRPDLIVLDIRMPKIDGIEVLEVIKSDKEHEDVKNIPVVMLTVSPLEKDKSECIKAGCDGYFIKDGSFKDFEKIINPIEECLKKKEFHDTSE